MIYFDNAATSGVKPPNVIKAVNEAMTKYCYNAGRSGYRESVETAEQIYKVREKAARFFGSKEPEKVIFTLNCTQSINMVLKGVVGKGDHVLVSSLEHNAVMRPLKKIGVSFDKALVSLTDDMKTAEEFRRKIRPNTRLILCTAASNVLGKALPLREIGKIARERGVLFAVDAAQGGGVMDINMEEMNIDYLCIAPHKGLYAATGTGILICRKPIFNTLIEGGTGTNSLELVQPDSSPERYESGTLNVAGILSIGAGIDFVKAKGMEKIYNHEMSLIGELYNGLRQNDSITLYTPYPKHRAYMPVLPFNFKGIESFEVADLLAENNVAVRGGFHCAPSAHSQMGTLGGGAVRISVSAFNNDSQAESFLRLVNSEKFIKKLQKNY